jgi:hypothetical protein
MLDWDEFYLNKMLIDQQELLIISNIVRGYLTIMKENMAIRISNFEHYQITN